MQTFLPYRSYRKSVQVLDPKRLGNQVYREGLTLLRGGWPNHPASKMWRGYEWSLAEYCRAGCRELISRGKTEVGRRWLDYFTKFQRELRNTGDPPWLGLRKFHASHRSNLLRKDPEWYGRYGWEEKPGLEYYWP